MSDLSCPKVLERKEKRRSFALGFQNQEKIKKKNYLNKGSIGISLT